MATAIVSSKPGRNVVAAVVPIVGCIPRAPCGPTLFAAANIGRANVVAGPRETGAGTLFQQHRGCARNRDRRHQNRHQPRGSATKGVEPPLPTRPAEPGCHLRRQLSLSRVGICAGANVHAPRNPGGGCRRVGCHSCCPSSSVRSRRHGLGRLRGEGIGRLPMREVFNRPSLQRCLSGTSHE